MRLQSITMPAVKCGATMAIRPEKVLMTLSLASAGLMERFGFCDFSPQSAISRNDVLRKRLALTRFYSRVNCPTGDSHVYISNGVAESLGIGTGTVQRIAKETG